MIVQDAVSFAVMLGIAILTGCGTGSGGLLVVYLTLVLGTAQSTAQAQNLIFFLMCAASSLLIQLKNHVKINFRGVLICSISALPGIVIGSTVRQNLPEDILRAVFGFMLVFCGVVVIFKKIKNARKVHYSSKKYT